MYYPLHISPPVEAQETSSPIMAQHQSFKHHSWISHKQLGCPVTALLSFLQAPNATLSLFLWALPFILRKNFICPMSFFFNFIFLTGVSLSRSKSLFDFVLLRLVLQLHIEWGNRCQVLPQESKTRTWFYTSSVTIIALFFSQIAKLLLSHTSLSLKKGSVTCAMKHFVSFPRNMD